MSSLHDGHRLRLREQYIENGLDGLMDHQVLELLLTYAIPRKDTNELAHRLLDRFGTLDGVLQADVALLMQVDGIGHGAAVFLHMQNDLSRRMQLARLKDTSGRIKLSNPYESAKYAAAILSREPYEAVYAACLNKSGFVQSVKNIVTGTLVEAPIYPRHIVEYALLQRAHSVVLMHNHPSGDPTPSKEDCDATSTVRAALSSVDIPLLDHLIAGGQYVYSFSADTIMLLQQGASQPITMTLDEFAVRLRQEATIVGETYAACRPLRFVREPDQ